MKENQFSNSEIAAIDWARGDRVKVLRRLNNRTFTAPASGVQGSGWGCDVSGADKRSVKAQLAGRGDLRKLWWATFSTAHRLLAPGSTLEQAMYRFHSMHHAVTLTRMGFMLEVRRMHATMVRHGFAAAVRGAISPATIRR